MASWIKDALHNLSKAECPNPTYCRGIVVGVVSAIMQERKCSYAKALKAVKKLLPEDYDRECFPEPWRMDV